MSKGEAFVTELYQKLCQLFPELEVKHHQKVEWPSELNTLFWPQADIWITNKKLKTTFIIEHDEDSDPGRSLVKYWPYLDKHKRQKPEIVVIIGLWRRGATFGEGYSKLAKFMGEKLEKLYPFFRYTFMEHRSETAEESAHEIVKIMDDVKELISDLRDTEKAMEAYKQGQGRDIEEVFKELELSYGL